MKRLKILIVSNLLLFNCCYSQVSNLQNLIYENYVKNYHELYICKNDTVMIPRINNIDSNLYTLIEDRFKVEDFATLYLLLAALKAQDKMYDERFYPNFYIIDDGLVCQENSIIKLIRLAMKSNVFIPSYASVEIETISDIMYWAFKNKNKIQYYRKIKKLQNQINR